MLKFDASGDLLSDSGVLDVSYSTRHLPLTVDAHGPNGDHATFRYDGDGLRVVKDTKDGTTTYGGALFDRFVDKGGTQAAQYRYYVPGPGRIVAILGVTVGKDAKTPPVSSTTYVHPDHLGSPDLLTDGAGKVLQRNSYDPFGQPRDPNWTSSAPPPPASGAANTTLGFTSHEDDTSLGLTSRARGLHAARLVRRRRDGDRERHCEGY